MKYNSNEPTRDSIWEKFDSEDHMAPLANDRKKVHKKEDGSVVYFTFTNVSKYIGDEALFEDVSFRVFKGSKIGILGLNGSGKSTLMNLMAGLDTEFTGNVRLSKNLKIGYFQQQPKLNEEGTVLDNVLDGVKEKALILRQFNELEQLKNQNLLTDKLKVERDRLLKIVESQNLLALDRKLELNMKALNCPAPDKIVKNLSGGEKRRVALCKLLTSENDILLLDEPTNHLDTDSIEWLEKHLCDFKGAVVVITHDRYFLDNVTDWILEVDRGNVIKFNGNYSEWLYEKQKRLELERRKELARARHIRQELEWIRNRGQKKNKAREQRLQELVSHEKCKEYEPGQIIIPPGVRLGKKLIKVNNLKKSFGNQILFDNVNFEIEPGSVVGIIGANGAGKTTLFKLLTGVIPCDSGAIEIGQTVIMRHVSQERVELDAEKTVLETISDGCDSVQVGDRHIHVRHYMSSFNIKGSLQDRLVSDLSGGEKNRVLLAKTLKDGCNLLLLDEPSNDLDLDTLRSLEDALCDFSGSAVVISHDRWFLDRICTHIIAFEGDSKVVFIPGNYTSYESERKKRQKTRSSYKKIVTA